MEKPIIGTKAMVVSPHYLASAAGARILERGGNAFDAAVAVSACLAVVYPHMTGVGGDSFWLSYHKSDGRVRGYNASGRSAYKASLEAFAGETAIPTRGARGAITVPGMVDGWCAVQSEYGRLPMAEVLESAIGYAAEGYPMSKDLYVHTAAYRSVLERDPAAASIFMPNGRILLPGERFIQRELARTLVQLAHGGRDAFYKGMAASVIADYLQDRGGLLTTDDFADHQGEWVMPIRGSYRGHEVYQMPPNSQGFVGLMALQVLERFDFSAIEHGSYEYYHLLVEVLKLCFRDRNAYLTDPSFSAIPLDRLLSREYAEELAGAVRLEKAADIASSPVGSDTAYAAVVDEEGNAVSFIQSLYFEFGSGVVGGNTGVLMQNRGSFFSLDPAHVNRLMPHKRTFHTLMPGMALQQGSPSYLFGTQGGEGQPQTQVTLLTRMIDYGMNPQQAISEPRFVWGRTWGEETMELRLESRIADETASMLAAAGHEVRRVNAYDGIVGHAHIIAVDRQGFLSAGTDPRCDGAAIGW